MRPDIPFIRFSPSVLSNCSHPEWYGFLGERIVATFIVEGIPPVIEEVRMEYECVVCGQRRFWG